MQTKTVSQKKESVSEFFLDLFGYNEAFNETCIILLYENERQISEKTLPLMSHIVNAHQIWNNRIESIEAPFGTWEIHSFNDLEKLNKNNHLMSTKLLSEYKQNETFHYRTAWGEIRSSSLRDILFHVINHSTHHRAQIATELKKSGIEPQMSDYILHRR